MKKRLFALAAVFAISGILSGCSNSIRTYQDSEDKVVRETIGTKYDVRFTPDPPVAPEFAVTALRVEKQQVRKYQVQVEGEIATPYEGWRESYEILCGILLLPVSICSHVISVVTFGVYPFSVSGAINDLSFTGMNPCLNWESEERVEKIVKTSTERLVDNVQEDKITPLANVAVTVFSGGKTKKYTTDKFGLFKLSLVGLNPAESIFNTDREFQFRVADDAKTTRKLVITREFAGKLLRARMFIVQYETAPSGKALVQTVKKLEELRFNDLAFALEKRELAKRKDDKAFMKDFNDATLE